MKNYTTIIDFRLVFENKEEFTTTLLKLIDFRDSYDSLNNIHFEVNVEEFKQPMYIRDFIQYTILFTATHNLYDELIVYLNS